MIMIIVIIVISIIVVRIIILYGAVRGAARVVLNNHKLHIYRCIPCSPLAFVNSRYIIYIYIYTLL